MFLLIGVIIGTVRSLFHTVIHRKAGTLGLGTRRERSNKGLLDIFRNNPALIDEHGTNSEDKMRADMVEDTNTTIGVKVKQFGTTYRIGVFSKLRVGKMNRIQRVKILDWYNLGRVKNLEEIRGILVVHQEGYTRTSGERNVQDTGRINTKTTEIPTDFGSSKLTLTSKISI